MSTVQSLRDSALSLLDGVKSHEVGFPRLESADAAGSLPLSAREQRLLDLYDGLERLELEASLHRAQAAVPEGPAEPPAGEPDERVAAAERELLEAKAGYSLRNNVIEGVLVTDPTLRAVHSGSKATGAERALLPRIQRRDVLSTTHTNLSASQASTLAALTTAETEHVMASRRNAESTQTLLRLAEETRTHVEDVREQRVRAQLGELEREVKIRRSRQRVMKSIVSAVVAGSGVDWARDERLRELVMDDEEGDAGG
ncbi:MAG: hypothetical protein M1832_006092 [Thelocarpon impressellum]|nr:MAG: hypothetical protein M1832_006092 [Thelocarpon impressellum]